MLIRPCNGRNILTAIAIHNYFRYDSTMMNEKMELSGLLDDAGHIQGARSPYPKWQKLPIWGLTNTRLVFGRHPFDFPPTSQQSANENQPAWVSAGPGLLDAFVSLAKASDEKILSYANRWGPLALCEKHKLPLTHPPVNGIDYCGKLHARSITYRDLNGNRATGKAPSEPLESWRNYAAGAKALLNLAASLHLGEPGQLEDWRTLGETEQPTGITTKVRRENARWIFSQTVQTWLRNAGIRVVYQWLGETPELTIGGQWLFGALSLQLAMAVGQSGGLATCTACSIFYTPSRRPRSGQRHYCASCREQKIPVRDAARTYRDRKRDSRKEDAHGAKRRTR